MDESNPVPQARGSRAGAASPVPAGERPAPGAPTIIDIDNVDFYYGQSKALHGINFPIKEKLVTAFIGPSGCGKSTLLRCLNRMNDLVDGTRIGAGSIKISGVDIYDPVGRRHRAAQAGRHGLPEIEPVPEIDLRERRLRPAPAGHQRQGARSTRRSSAACAARRCGRRCATGCTPARSAFPAASSSAFASRAPSPSSPRSSSWTSPAPRSTPSPRSRSRS